MSLVCLPLDTFELHSVELVLEAVEKQIHDLQAKQAELRERRAMLEASRLVAHLSQGNSRREITTPSTSTPCVSLSRPSAPRKWPAQVLFTPLPGYRGPWVQQRKMRARPRSRMSPVPPPPVFKIPTRNRFAPFHEMDHDAVIIGDSIVPTSVPLWLKVRLVLTAYLVQEHRSCGSSCRHERQQPEAVGDPEEGIQHPGGNGLQHSAHGVSEPFPTYQQGIERLFCADGLHPSRVGVEILSDHISRELHTF